MSSPFRRRTLITLVTVTALSFGLALLLSVFDDGLGGDPSTGSDTFSVSALGHAAWIEMLDHAGVPIVVARSARREGQEGLLVVAEPELDEETMDAVVRRIRSSSAALIVLPKRLGVRDRRRPEWIRGVTTVPADQVDTLLERLEVDARVIRPTDGLRLGRWSGSDRPTLSDPQLLTSVEGVETILGGPDGVLLGRVRFRARPVLILSDPDIIANHGLHRGDNAAIALRAVRDAASAGTVAVFDETVHGFALERSIWRELFRFPLAFATVHAALALILLLWAGMVRFGTPELVPPELGEGRRALIDNTADLLAYGGHSAHALRRSFDRAVDDVLARYGDETLRRRERLAAVEAIAAQRGVTVDVRRIAADVSNVVAVAGRRGASARRIVAIARRVHAWRRETLDGTR